MEFDFPSVQDSVNKLKQDINLLEIDPYKLVAPSAYETAWLAMVPDDDDEASRDHHQLPSSGRPMFRSCLDWVLNNQRIGGFWGDCDGHYGSPSLDAIPATIACMVALKKWKVGDVNLHLGLEFLRGEGGKLLEQVLYECSSCPVWFVVVFPAMVELAHANGLANIFPQHFNSGIFLKRQRILEREKTVNGNLYPPLYSYLEALPLDIIEEDQISESLWEDGSLFQSPSATAIAFITTGNKSCLSYLQSVVRKCFNGGVPPTYPIDGDLTKLCLINQFQKLGVVQHFDLEVDAILLQFYRNYVMRGDTRPGLDGSNIAPRLLKDSLAFRTLRMHGYTVSPRSFCWFLQDSEIQHLIEKNHEYFSSAMLCVYAATDLMFPGEDEIHEAREFSKMILEKTLSTATKDQFNNVPGTSPNLLKMIAKELSLPWLARMDHLDHRQWIELDNATALWMGKSSYHRLPQQLGSELMQLAVQNFHIRQSVYRKELYELTRWASRLGLTEMGFGREKSTYAYFAIASSTSLPLDSHVRMIVAKAVIVVTVADDFYDMEATLDELQSLTDAIRRWNGDGLSGHGKTIFEALDNLVREIEEMHLEFKGIGIQDNLRFIWMETFESWLKEAKWSKEGYLPSTEEYLETGSISIASHTLILPASIFLEPNLPINKLSPLHYETITKLVMVIPRLLNDIQGYEKEVKEGKTNFVLLYMKENPEAKIEDSIAYVRGIIQRKKLEFMKLALMEGLGDLPKSSRQLHLSCLRVFQMFFNSTNLFDSDTALLQDIQNAIFLPIEFGPEDTA